MILAPQDAALFYRAWGALLTWVNDQRHIVPAFPRPTPDRPIGPSLVNPIRKVLWAEDELRERFVAECAADVASAERDLIRSWKHRVSGQFLLYKHLQNHSIFMSKDVFGVLGLYTPFPEMFPRVPMFVHAVLLPFHDVIITDGLLESPGVQLSFGAGIRRVFKDQYGKARAASQIQTRLRPPAEQLPLAIAPRPGSPAKTSARAKARSGDPQHRFGGQWRITATESWDRDMLDSVQPAFLRFHDGRRGELGMIVIRAELDCRYGERDSKPLVEFTFEGDDDGYPCHGRGWATLDADGALRGRIHIHQADDSAFVAERVTASTMVSPARRRGRRPAPG